MTDTENLQRTRRRPGRVVPAAVLTLVVAAYPLGQLLFAHPFGASAGMLAPYVLSALATAACWVATVPGFLRGTAWARVAVTAISAFTVAQAMPLVLTVVDEGADPVLLAFSAAALAPLAIVATLWSRGARAWFDPLR